LDSIASEIDKREGGVIMTALGPESYALAEAYLDMHYFQLQGYALTALGDALDMKVAEAAVYRKPAVAAIRMGVFNIDVPAGSRFSTPNGSRSVVFRVEDRQSEGVYRLVAETPGLIGNEYAGAIIPITYIEGLQSAVLADVVIPGAETEADEPLRKRYLDRLNQKPFGGNIADYRKNILEIPGVGEVEVFPVWNGGGTVKCSIVDAEYLPAEPGLVEYVQGLIDPVNAPGNPSGEPLGLGLAPIGAKVTITAPAILTVNVSASLTLVTGVAAEQIHDLIEESIEEYIRSVRSSFGDPVDAATGAYALFIYAARVIEAILRVEQVINVTNLRLNGAAADIAVAQTGAAQFVPVLGEVTLNAAASA
jgi:uncharacterized phage protein gp47/JayE